MTEKKQQQPQHASRQALLATGTVALALEAIAAVALVVNNCSGMQDRPDTTAHAAFGQMLQQAATGHLQPSEMGALAVVALAIAALAGYACYQWQRLRRWRRRYRELLGLYRQRQQFMAKVSREMRTPLHSIVGFVRLLNTPGVTISRADRAEINRQLQESADALAGLADKLAVLSQYDTMSEVELCHAVDVAGLIGELAEEYRPKVRQGVRVDVFSYLPSQYLLLTNQAVLTHVLRHLLDNAVRFTRRGHVTIIADLPSAGAEWLLLSVSDSGPGIPPERRPTVFGADGDYDGDADGDGTDGGDGEAAPLAPAGTGLAICRTMMRLLGGTIEIDDNYTTGTSILLKLPTGAVGPKA